METRLPKSQGAGEWPQRLTTALQCALHSLRHTACCALQVNALLVRDPTKRLTSSDLVTHPWVRGEDVPSKPLPSTHERLSAFIKARHAFYGSLLMGILAHHLTSATGAEGVGANTGVSEFDAFDVGWKLFDKDNKGHIDANDLRRVCFEMGYKVSQRDVENMLAVMAPTQRSGSFATPASADEPETAAAEAAAKGSHAKISFERYKTTMQASFMRRYERGSHIFVRGDPVDHFYVITRGHCDVLVPKSQLNKKPSGSTAPSSGSSSSGAGSSSDDGGSGGSSDDGSLRRVPSERSLLSPTPTQSLAVTSPVGGLPMSVGDAPATAKPRPDVGYVDEETGDVVIASLGPGDFFGETGLLENRTTRAASVICRTQVEVMAMDREIFKQVAGSGDAQGNKLADSMKERADARQRARLTKVFELMNVAAQNRRTYQKGSVVFRQGEKVCAHTASRLHTAPRSCYRLITYNSLPPLCPFHTGRSLLHC